MIINEKTEPFKLESLKDWIKDAKLGFEKTLKGPDGCLGAKQLIAGSKIEFVNELIKVIEQCSCKHKNTELRENVGYDIDEEGEEDQHLEKCKDCGAERFQIDHTKHGKSTGCWFVVV